MEKRKLKRFGLTDCLLVGASVLYLVLMLLVFRACGQTEEGTWMSCHWAHRCVLAFAITLILQSLLHLVFGEAHRKQGISFAMAVTAFMSMLIPGRFVGLCMMADMNCHRLMVPGTLVLSILVILAAAVDIVVQIKRVKEQKA